VALVNISKYGVIYASGGKNLGPAGTTVVIARKDLVNIGARPETPSVLDWKKFATTAPIPSLYNTPPTFLIYMAGPSWRCLFCLACFSSFGLSEGSSLLT